MAASQMSSQGKQQQQQPANHSSGNAETARYLTPFSYPEEILRQVFIVNVLVVLTLQIQG